MDKGKMETARRLAEFLVDRRMATLMRHKNRYLQAFIAETGIHPIDLRMVERHEKDGAISIQYLPKDEFLDDEGKAQLDFYKRHCLELERDHNKQIADLREKSSELRGIGGPEWSQGLAELDAIIERFDVDEDGA